MPLLTPPSPFTPRVALSLAALSLLLLRRANQVQLKLHIIMPGGERKVGAREAKTALNSAAAMAEVFRDAGELALERELNFVCEQLRKNEPLLYRLSGYLKDDSLVALLDGRMNATVGQEDGGSSRGKGLKAASGVLRQAWKKSEHIEGDTAFLISLLRAAWGLGGEQ